ncbi:hypothetical protein GCM10027290_57950 [Micromonospora sonneratiae]|uniref:Uncharacterized protein n=1 Tax=Micromonospora sonneratiae TaxID=1184706 RepID=A0ABW3YHD0_9ACTN
MEIYTYERPSALPVVCAPMPAVWAPLTVAASSVPQVHQVQAQAELLLAVAPAGNKGTTGFMGKGIRISSKRTDVRGVPPRGRPV